MDKNVCQRLEKRIKRRGKKLIIVGTKIRHMGYFLSFFYHSVKLVYLSSPDRTCISRSFSQTKIASPYFYYGTPRSASELPRNAMKDSKRNSRKWNVTPRPPCSKVGQVVEVIINQSIGVSNPWTADTMEFFAEQIEFCLALVPVKLFFSSVAECIRNKYSFVFNSYFVTKYLMQCLSANFRTIRN